MQSRLRDGQSMSVNLSTMISTNSTDSSKLSARSSPPSPAKIAMADVASIFIKLRRTREKIKSHHIASSSGEPQTHPSLTGDGVTCTERVEMELNETYVCMGAVDVVKLLRCSRTKLFEKASYWNANVLINEQWNCTICGPKFRKDGTFRVHICYSASASRSSRPDPQKPVALEKVKSVPGLMTVLSRRS